MFVAVVCTEVCFFKVCFIEVCSLKVCFMSSNFHPVEQGEMCLFSVLQDGNYFNNVSSDPVLLWVGGKYHHNSDFSNPTDNYTLTL